MIYYFTPFAPDKLYGRAINEHIKHLPDDSWICVRDGDTMFLTSDYGHIIQQAIIDNPGCDLFSCSTNRAFGQKMSNDPNVLTHYREAINREKSYTKITGIVPAFFWVFNKRHWLKYPFDEHPIIHNRKSFDVRWCRDSHKWEMLRIDHLYIFHLYRLHKPRRDYSHLV